MVTYSLVRFAIIRDIYENPISRELHQCDRKSKRDGEFQAMITNNYLLAGAIRKLNKDHELGFSPMRMIEYLRPVFSNKQRPADNYAKRRHFI